MDSAPACFTPIFCRYCRVDDPAIDQQRGSTWFLQTDAEGTGRHRSVPSPMRPYSHVRPVETGQHGLSLHRAACQRQASQVSLLHVGRGNWKCQQRMDAAGIIANGDTKGMTGGRSLCHPWPRTASGVSDPGVTPGDQRGWVPWPSATVDARRSAARSLSSASPVAISICWLLF